MLKIADFGFARSLPSTSLAETLCGSPLYMAPEILRYEKYDAKADLWSVGTVLYEMVVGKPPFRATNHVELLRKIERGEDKIKFPEDNEASDDIKKLIRGLLKRNPVERITFKDFFDNIVIQGEIPGLASEDRPAERRRSADADAAAADQARLTRAARESGGRESPLLTNAQRPLTSRLRSETPPDASPMRRAASGEKPVPAGKDLQRAAVTAQRPGVVSHTTAPGRQELLDRNSAAAAMERQRSRTTYPPDSSPSHEQMRERQKQEEAAREERERAAQDVAFERDYVVVEKRAVEVNAFADELANSPRIHGGLPNQTTSKQGAVPRRTTTHGAPSAAGNQAASSKAMQVAPGRNRSDAGHHRQSSYERRYGQSPTSAISKAITMASGRLFGVGFSPPLAKGGRSPPLGYNPYPAYPTTQGSLMIVGDGAKTNVALDEDTKTVQIIEECATRSDVVYGFAEVKYKQLIPLTPSTDAAKPGAPTGDGATSDSADGGLTVDAIVTLSEEALVLYVKALALLAKSMDIAGAWWARKNSGEVFGDSPPRGEGMSATSALVGTRINNVVQWVRNRFNEVLEKAEFVRLKLIEGQKRLPPDHPSHPNNHPPDSSTTGGLGTSADNVVVSTGVTAEKLMYDRALEMSRAAAINELTGEDLPGCEIAYVTAIRMLEAVLESDEVPRPRKGNEADKGADQDKIVLDGVQVEDRKVVVKRKHPSSMPLQKQVADRT